MYIRIIIIMVWVGFFHHFCRPLKVSLKRPSVSGGAGAGVIGEEGGGGGEERRLPKLRVRLGTGSEDSAVSKRSRSFSSSSKTTEAEGTDVRSV